MSFFLLHFLLFPLQVYLSTPSNNINYNKWVVTGSSKLEIQGSTNVNKFRCLSTNYHGGDTLVESVNRASGFKTLEGQVNLRSSDFDCEHALITRDFKKTLKAETYPEVHIKFLQLKESNEGKTYTGVLEITIAGVSRKYPVTCAVQTANAKEKYFAGTNHFELSDFKLDPPEKFFGAVKVANKVSVNFQLRLKAV